MNAFLKKKKREITCLFPVDGDNSLKAANEIWSIKSSFYDCNLKIEMNLTCLKDPLIFLEHRFHFAPW